MENLIDLETCIIKRKEEFILLEFKKIDRNVNQKDAEEILESRISLECEPEEKQLIIADIRNAGQTDKGARAVAKTEKMVNHTKGLALIVGGAFSKVLGNFFIGFNKGEFPVKIFVEPEEAKKWLLAL